MDQDNLKEIYDEINKLPTDSLKKKMLEIQNLNIEKSKLEEEGYEKEYNIVKDGFDAQYRVIYEEISKIVKGELITELPSAEKTKYQIAEAFPDSEKGIPEYWGIGLKNAGYFMVNEKDEEILKHLIDVRMKPLENSRLNFIMEFEFAPNDYFQHTVLTKTYLFNEKTEEAEKGAGFKIEWSSKEKNPCIQIKTKKVKKGKNVETKKTESEVESFFDIFNEAKEDLIDEANFWKEDFLANSFEYYLNIVEPDFDDEEEEFDTDEDEEDEEGDEEDHKKGKKAGKKAEGADKNEKCKNQ